MLRCALLQQYPWEGGEKRPQNSPTSRSKEGQVTVGATGAQDEGRARAAPLPYLMGRLRLWLHFGLYPGALEALATSHSRIGGLLRQVANLLIGILGVFLVYVGDHGVQLEYFLRLVVLGVPQVVGGPDVWRLCNPASRHHLSWVQVKREALT